MSQAALEFPGTVVVVIPTYNERENLAATVSQVLAVDGVRVLVVDDESTDGTGELADALAREHAPRVSVLHRRGARGIGPAYLAGFQAALAAGADVVCQMDADGSHAAADLPSLLSALNDADLVIGSRYVRGAHVFDWPMSRRVLSRAGNAYARVVTELPVHDATGGFRAWRRSALQRLSLDRVQARTHGFMVEMTYAASRARLRVAEVPIQFRDRQYGESKVSGRVVLESLLVPWRLLLRDVGLAAAATIAAAVIVEVAEASTLVRRGAAGASDIGIFQRTCALLREGVREIYPRADAVTGWPISMPPVGFAIFQPFSRFGTWGSSASWALFNLALLAASIVILRRVLWRAADPRYERACPWAVALLLFLAAGSIQVGQFSILFVFCWLLCLDAFSRGRRTVSALWLAMPAAVKVYPVGIAAAPLSSFAESVVRDPRTAVRVSARYVAWLLAGILACWFVVPAIPYGTDTVRLNVSWWHGVILNNAQMDYLQDLRAISNQSLDTMLLRYLSYDPAFHDRFTQIPHLAIAKATVLRLAHLVRLVIIAISAVAVWMRVRRSRAADGAHTTPVTGLIALMALWVATLYNVIPETKSRYAVYTFIAFLPWVARAVDRAIPATRRVAVATGIVAGAACALVLLPDTAQAWGIGFLGPFGLWVANAALVASTSDS